MMCNNVLLRTRSITIDFDSDSTLLVLNRTLYDSINTLLASTDDILLVFINSDRMLRSISDKFDLGTD